MCVLNFVWLGKEGIHGEWRRSGIEIEIKYPLWGNRVAQNKSPKRKQQRNEYAIYRYGIFHPARRPGARHSSIAVETRARQCPFSVNLWINLTQPWQAILKVWRCSGLISGRSCDSKWLFKLYPNIGAWVWNSRKNLGLCIQSKRHLILFKWEPGGTSWLDDYQLRNAKAILVACMEYLITTHYHITMSQLDAR